MAKALISHARDIMRIRFVSVAAFALVFCVRPPVSGDESPSKAVVSELAAARREGWTITTLLVQTLRAGNQNVFPGIAAWGKDFDKVAARIDVKRSPEDRSMSTVW